MKTQPTTRHNGSSTYAITEPVPGRKRVSALLMRLLWAAALVLPALGAQAGVVFTSLHSFGGNDGAHPNGLAQGSDGNFYGTTEYGGAAYTNQFGQGLGTVFKISPNGALTNLYSFTGGDNEDDAYPHAGLVQGSDGNFYGTTCGIVNEAEHTQGWSWLGTIFQISTSGVLTILHSFFGGNDGSNPQGPLVQGSDGNFYGTTSSGDSVPKVNLYGDGTVFKISTDGALTDVYSFGTIDHLYGRSLDGAFPQAGLVQGSDGNFYGTTEQGGTNNAGTVFKISTNGVLTSLYSFGGNDGAFPYAGLVQGGDGTLYGTTSDTLFGTPYGNGTVFKISTNGVLATLHSFNGTNDGANPLAGLVQGRDGNVYGTTANGGSSGNGTVFSVKAKGTGFSTLYSFSAGSTNSSGVYTNSDGANPQAGLVQGADGSFYGTTSGGGQGGAGTVFRLTIVPNAPVFQTVTLTNGTLILAWSTEAGGRYQVQYNSDLNSSNWTNLRGPVTAPGATLSTTDSVANAPRRFYRLVLSP